MFCYLPWTQKGLVFTRVQIKNMFLSGIQKDSHCHSSSKKRSRFSPGISRIQKNTIQFFFYHGFKNIWVLLDFLKERKKYIYRFFPESKKKFRFLLELQNTRSRFYPGPKKIWLLLESKKKKRVFVWDAKRSPFSRELQKKIAFFPGNLWNSKKERSRFFTSDSKNLFFFTRFPKREKKKYRFFPESKKISISTRVPKHKIAFLLRIPIDYVSYPESLESKKTVFQIMFFTRDSKRSSFL